MGFLVYHKKCWLVIPKPPSLSWQGRVMKPAMLLGKNMRSFPDAEKQRGIHQVCHKQLVSFGNLVLF